jgi:hypothetical protein
MMETTLVFWGITATLLGIIGSILILITLVWVPVALAMGPAQGETTHKHKIRSQVSLDVFLVAGILGSVEVPVIGPMQGLLLQLRIIALVLTDRPPTMQHTLSLVLVDGVAVEHSICNRSGVACAASAAAPSDIDKR